MSQPETATVRWTPYRYTGWRRLWRRITLRPVESPTYEFEAIPPGTYESDDDYLETGFQFRTVGPVKRIDP